VSAAATRIATAATTNTTGMNGILLLKIIGFSSEAGGWFHHLDEAAVSNDTGPRSVAARRSRPRRKLLA
jgi:hypothetical protein